MLAKSIRFHNRTTGAHSRSRRALFPARHDRGIALLLSLMLLALMSVMSVVMVMTVSPDMLINGYYGNFRGSFYAADSGLSMARQQLVNQVTGYVSTNACTGWAINIPAGSQASCGKAPLNIADNTTNATTAAADAASAIIANVLAPTSGGYGNYTSLNSGQAANSWPGSFQIINTGSCPSTFTPVTGTPTVLGTNNVGQNSIYQYQFNYQLCSQGRATGSQQVYASEYGVLTLMIKANYSPQQSVSFSAFGGFVSNYPPCLGPLVPGTMEGPMFTNGAWQFQAGGPYIFTGPVGQANANADYYIGGHCNQSPTASYTSGGVTIAPTFQGGFSLGQAPIALPPNDFSQKWAVLDGVGCGEGSTTCGSGMPPNPANSDLHAALRDINGTAYPSTGASSGVFLPYSCVGGTCTMNGGGIYVEGSAGVALSTGSDSSDNLTQIYTITQGGTTTTITTPVYPNNNYTTVTSGGTTVTLSGVPMNKVSSTPQQGTLLYVDGTISSLSGPGQGQAAIQDHSQVTIVGNGNVNITGDVIYKHEANTLDTSDTPIFANNTNQVLGIFTANGNINLSSPYANNNLQVDGALAPLGQNCSTCGFTVSGYINTFNNYGGQSQTNIFAANMTTENTYYDTRFATGFGPPWFPSTTIAQSDINVVAPTVTPTVTRMSWSTSPQ
jgi:Tfp pilus assembly protein PilX